MQCNGWCNIARKSEWIKRRTGDNGEMLWCALGTWFNWPVVGRWTFIEDRRDVGYLDKQSIVSSAKEQSHHQHHPHQQYRSNNNNIWDKKKWKRWRNIFTCIDLIFIRSFPICPQGREAFHWLHLLLLWFITTLTRAQVIVLRQFLHCWIAPRILLEGEPQDIWDGRNSSLVKRNMICHFVST